MTLLATNTVTADRKIGAQSEAIGTIPTSNPLGTERRESIDGEEAILAQEARLEGEWRGRLATGDHDFVIVAGKGTRNVSQGCHSFGAEVRQASGEWRLDE
jgi:hypothetical protein